MNTYSYFFHTLHHEEKALAEFGFHHSVLRTVVFLDEYEEGFKKEGIGLSAFQDLVVLWDEDHDERIIWVLEQLHHRGGFPNDIVAIGEHKGGVDVYYNNEGGGEFDADPDLHRICEDIIGEDSFQVDSHVIDLVDPRNIAEHVSIQSAVYKYILGIDAVWGLGVKPSTFSLTREERWSYDLAERLKAIPQPPTTVPSEKPLVFQPPSVPASLKPIPMPTAFTQPPVYYPPRVDPGERRRSVDLPIGESSGRGRSRKRQRPA